MLEAILRDTQYEECLGGQNDIEAISRRENIGELLSALEDFHNQDASAGLDGFLERVALVNAQDDLSDEDAVSLMSLHCAKGLEYSAVFMVGMEDPIFPSARAVSDQGHFEEERRLFYVGITRAKDLLFLSRADSRLFYGRPNYNTPSLFLSEVPGECMRTLEEARRQWSEQIARRRAEKDQIEGRETRPAFHESRGGKGTGTQGKPNQGETSGQRDRADEGDHGGAENGDEGGLFPIGTRVRHSRLGSGEVVGASGQGDRRKVSIRFDAGLELEVLERYGGLEQVPDEDLPY